MLSATWLFGGKSLGKKQILGNSLAIQWLRLHTSTAGGTSLTPGWRTVSGTQHLREQKGLKSEEVDEVMPQSLAACGTQVQLKSP